MSCLLLDPRVVFPVHGPFARRAIPIPRAMRHGDQRVPVLAVRFQRIGSRRRVTSQGIFSWRHWLKVSRIHAGRLSAKVIKLEPRRDRPDYDFICAPMCHCRDFPVRSHIPSGSVPGMVKAPQPHPAILGLVNKLPKCIISPVLKSPSQVMALIVLGAADLGSSICRLALAPSNSAGIIRKHRESLLMVSCGRARQRRCRFLLYMTSNEYGT